jgi:hypothetical protein
MSRIEVAPQKRALYFGSLGHGHFLHTGAYRSTLDPEPGFPWTMPILDSGLPRNRKVPDEPDGHVHWTGGGSPFWFAFFWWDRSEDRRGASNSGFYVTGFHYTEPREAFAFACAEWAAVVQRQLHPLVLVGVDGRPEASAMAAAALAVRAGR